MTSPDAVSPDPPVVTADMVLGIPAGLPRIRVRSLGAPSIGPVGIGPSWSGCAMPKDCNFKRVARGPNAGMFGSWVSRVDELARQLQTAQPFSHVVIPDFFADPHALAAAFPPSEHAGWLRYHNPLEKKHAMPAVGDLGGPVAAAFEALQSDEFLLLVRRVSAIDNLEHDPGLHAHPRGGKLDVHLDYSIHPVTGQERRLNLIVFLNPRWQDEWGGHLQLWAPDMSWSKAVAPRFNTAVLFQTCDISWHGPISCPETERRMSLATYYVSQPSKRHARPAA